MAAPPAQAFATHLLNQTLASIALLEQLSVINPSDAHTIRSKLPSPTGPFPSLNAPPDLSSSFGGLSVAPYAHQSPPHQQQQQQLPPTAGWQSPPPVSGPPALPPRGRGEQRAKALWDYNGVQDDLSFRQGDTLLIDEEVNEQWYRGRVVPQGQSYPLERAGLFPSNYIEKLQPGQQLQQSQQQPPYYQSPPSQMVPYQPPGPPQQYSYEKPPGGYGPPAPPQHSYGPPPTQQAVVVQQGEEKKHGKFGKIGGQLGNAAVNGAGFGFGASIASEMVHKIF